MSSKYQHLFDVLEEIHARPKPFEYYTADDLWTDDHTSKQMLSFHLDEKGDIASRNINFIEKSVEWITSAFHVNGETNIIDFGCGPGLYSSRLAMKGCRVTGIDFSENSIRYAKKQAGKLNLNIRYISQNYLDYVTGERFDIVLMIMCDYCALSPEQRKIMLEKIRLLSKPSTRIILDVYSLVSFQSRNEVARHELNLLNGFWSPNKYYGFLNSFKYEEEKVVLDKYTIVEPKRVRTIYNWLQYFDTEALISELSGCKLRVVDVYSDLAGNPFDPQSAEFAVVAEPI